MSGTSLDAVQAPTLANYEAYLDSTGYQIIQPPEELLEEGPLTDFQEEYYARAELSRRRCVQQFIEQPDSVNAIIGIMSSRKTGTLINVSNDLLALGVNVEVFESNAARRGDPDRNEIFTRDGTRLNKAPQFIDEISEIVAMIADPDTPEGSVIALVETSFMGTSEELQTLFQAAKAKGIGILADGLSAWFNGERIGEIQTLLSRADLVCPLAAWDQYAPNLEGAATARFVTIELDGSIVEDTTGETVAALYQGLDDPQLLRQLSDAFIQKLADLNRPELARVLSSGQNGAGQIQIPSYPTDEKKLIGLDQYRPVSAETFQALYQALHMAMEALGIESHDTLLSATDVRDLYFRKHEAIIDWQDPDTREELDAIKEQIF